MAKSGCEPVVPFYKPARPREAWDWANGVVTKTATHGRYTKGPQAALLREELASFLGVNEERIILTGSGSTALALAARSLHDFYLPDDDNEMGVPAFGYRGTDLAMRMGGWATMPVDVDALTWCQDRGGVLPYGCQVDIFGNPARVEYDATIVDSAHSLPTADKRRRRGCVECFSLAASKLITGGEGGVILVNKSDLVPGIAEYAAFFSRLPEMSAALARWHLKRVEALVDARMPAWDWYTQHVPFKHQRMRPGFTPSVFAFLHPRRDEFLRANAQSGVEMRAYYSEGAPIPGHPIAERIRDSVVALPLYDGIRHSEVVDRLKWL